jgi:TonB family protein
MTRVALLTAALAGVLNASNTPQGAIAPVIPSPSTLIVDVGVDYFGATPNPPEPWTNTPGKRLANRLKELWSVPPELASQRGRVLVGVTLEADGRLSEATIIEPSPTTALNTAAMSAVFRVDRTVLRGNELPSSRLPLTIAFYYNEVSTPGPLPIPAGWPPTSAFRPGAGVTLPSLVREVKPKYTRLAMTAGIQGAVLVEGIVRADGKIEDAIVLRSLDRTFGLDDEAIATVKQWQFVPGARDGTPVPVIITVELSFTLK